MRRPCSVSFAAALLVFAMLGAGVLHCQGAEKKVALVIGNSAYDIGPLKNAGNDASDMATALRSLGFSVTLGLDATKRSMYQLIDQFGAAIRGADIALFYYSGHGVQSGGENYLIPVGAEISIASDVELEGVQLQRLIGRMNAAGAGTNVIILDACRNNPFPQAVRDMARGLAVVGQKPPESIIVYATEAGETADDGSGRNGVFTASLLRHLSRNEEFTVILRDVNADVRKETEQKQRPAKYDNLTRALFLAGAPSGSAPRPSAPAPSPQPTSAPQPQPQNPPQPAAQPSAKTAEILVTADRDGAEVFVDGTKLGTAGSIPNLFSGIPAEREVVVEARQSAFVARETVTLAKGELREFTFKLEREKGRLFIRVANPASYTLVLDGEKQGRLSESGLVNGIGAGEREVELIGYGLYWKGKVTVKAGSETTILTATPWEDEKKAPKDMILVQGGTFMMGSNEGSSDEKPVHQVTVSSFMIGKYEVTQEQYQKVMGTNPSKFTSGSEAPRRPVEQVSWYDAVAFCNKLSELEGLQKVYTINGTDIRADFSKNGYRLPTEAEWEYAARGGSQSRGYTYSGSNSIDSVAWYSNNSGSSTHAVGTKAPNELGLYDMSGNVWEWCWDWYKNSYDSWAQKDPMGASSGDRRVNRGGSWSNSLSNLRSDSRDFNSPGFRHYLLGFRLLRRP